MDGETGRYGFIDNEAAATFLDAAADPFRFVLTTLDEAESRTTLNDFLYAGSVEVPQGKGDYWQRGGKFSSRSLRDRLTLNIKFPRNSPLKRVRLNPQNGT